MHNLPPDLDNLSPQDKRKLLERMLRERQTGDIGEKAQSQGYIFPQDYLDLQEKFGELEKLESGPLYFQPSEGINRDTTVIGGRSFINFAGYNYLGMSGDPVVSRAAKEAIERYGTSVSASRLASGERPFHRELEREIAEFLDLEDSLVFVGGYTTNESVIGHVCRPDDLILYDSLIHASVQTGCKLSGAKIRPFPHNNWQSLDTILQGEREKYHQVLIIIEGVYSMDGDIPDLPRFIEVKKRHRALLMIDEAHSIGVLGEHGAGIGEYYDIERADADLWMGTLSKAFASCGGFIAGDSDMIRFLKYTTPGFVYSVGMPPANTAAALASLRLMQKEPQRVQTLHDRAGLFLELAKSHGLNTGTSRDSAVIPIVIGQSIPCVRLYKALYDSGIYVLPIMYPTVPENASRLRFFVNCTHTEEQIKTTIEILHDHHKRLC